MAFVRKSKFKHIYGKPVRKDQCYENIRVTKSSWDSTFCVVNPKHLAIVTEQAGGGAFIVLPISQVGRLDRDPPLVAGHKATVLDIAWCPHNDDIIASASEDCTVKVWLIPEGGLKPRQNLTEPVMELIRHQRRVGLIVWHPTAASVLLSAGADNKVFIWNVEAGECLVEMEFPDMITSASFSYNGSQLVLACKDKKTRIVNPRTGQQVAEAQLHDGNKTQQVCYLRNGDLVTTGFSKTGDRQVALWKTDNLSSPLAQHDLDTSNGVNFIFYDCDTNMIYLCGKGDSVVRYFEITEEEPYLHFINLFQSNEPQRGMGFMPKRGLNVNECEIMRFYKLHTKGLCEVIPFIVPRKSELFQEDLYPPTPGDVPALSAQDWFDGKDAEPILINLKDGYKPSASVAASLSRKIGSTVATAIGSKPDAATIRTHDQKPRHAFSCFEPVTPSQPEAVHTAAPPAAATKKPQLPSEWTAPATGAAQQNGAAQQQQQQQQNEQLSMLQREFVALKAHSTAQSTEAEKQNSQITSLQEEIESLKQQSATQSSEFAALKQSFEHETHKLHAQIAALTDLVRSLQSSNTQAAATSVDLLDASEEPEQHQHQHQQHHETADLLGDDEANA